MKKYLYLWLILPFVVLSCHSTRRMAEAPASGKVPDRIEMQSILGTLADDMLQGRLTGSRGEMQAAKFIRSKMEQYGLMGAGEDDSFYQSFPFKNNMNPHAKTEAGNSGKQGTNVIGYYNNTAPFTVIIGAHYDHLGLGGKGSGSRSTKSGEVHNGADDNASGVSALLLLARHAETLPKEYNYLFIAFSGEEEGLIGSKYFAANPTINLDKVAYMINMDMVGRMRDNKLLVNGTGTSPTWNNIISDNNPQKLHLVKSASGIGPSDHTSFYLKNIPVLHLFTGQHKDYHKPSDDVALINWEGIEKTIGFVQYIIQNTADKGKLSFSKTKDTQSKRPAIFKVTLGVMPDYAYEGEGLHIDGVIEGRPADNAGIKDGDVVLQIGPHKVMDIYSYMEALSKFEKGQEAEITIKRGDKILKKKLTF